MLSLRERLRRPLTSEFTSPELPSHHSTLPKLPTKAKARFDHLGFREQGSRVAKERIDALEERTGTLIENEEQLTKERGNLLISAKKELAEAGRKQRSIRRGLPDDAEYSYFQGIFEDVKLQYRETISALEIEIEKGGVQEGLLISDDKTLTNATERKRRKLNKKMRSQKEQRRRFQTLAQEVQDLKKKLGDLEEEQKKDVDEYEDPRSQTKVEDDHEDDHEDDREDEDHEDEGHAGEGHADEDHADEDHADEGHADEGHADEGHADEGHADEGHAEQHPEGGPDEEHPGDNYDEEDGNEENKHKKESSAQNHGTEREKNQVEERNKQKGRLGEQGRVLRSFNIRKLSETLRKKTLKMERCKEMLSLSEGEIDLLRKELENLGKDEAKDDTKTPSEDGNHGEQDAREKRQEDDEEDEYLKRQDEREKRLRRVKSRLQRMKGMMRKEKRFEGYFNKTSRRYRLRQRIPTYLYDSDTTSSDSDLMPDDSDSEETEADDPILLNSLETVISHTEVLESQIWKIQEHRKKLSHVVDLKTVLLVEMRLERIWLEHLEGHAMFPGSKPRTPQHGHLSGRPISNEVVYKPLKDDQFRVLILFPAPEKCYPLICALETWSTKDLNGSKDIPQREYAALSYFWGSDTCNGRVYLVPSRDEGPGKFNQDWGYVAKRATEVRIRNSLFRALLRLRKDGPNAHPVALWVDSMCINQDDMEEKTEQLARMVNIYSKASNVCIWLGESDSKKRSDEAMEFISTIMDFAVLDRHAKDKKQAKKWYALGELMRDRWFSRRWVVQEIALSKDATVHCGGAIVRWSDFADAASLLISNQETIKSLFDFSEWREGPNTLGDVQSFGASILLEATNNLFLRKHNGELKRPTKTIESLVTSLKTFDTTDPRDLIYSLVCIASDTKVGPWASDPNDRLSGDSVEYHMDYSKPVVDVYKYFTKFCISSSGSLDIICRPWAMPINPSKGIDSSREPNALPSWIPLLSTSELGEPEEIYSGRKNGEVLVGQAGKPTYRASGIKQYDSSNRQSSPVQSKDSSANAQYIDGSTDDKGFLSARGFKLAKINKISQRNTGGVILRESLAMGGWTGINNNPNSVPDPIWRTLVADRDQDGQLPPSWYQRACLRCLEIADTFNNGDLNVGELLQGHSDMLRKYLTRVRNVTWNRRFFTAKTEGVQDEEQSVLFGICPPKSEEGDFVCILYGCSIPVVLRRGSNENEFMELVGEAYVHGKMDGEAMEDISEDQRQSLVEEFKIR